MKGGKHEVDNVVEAIAEKKKKKKKKNSNREEHGDPRVEGKALVNGGPETVTKKRVVSSRDEPATNGEVDMDKAVEVLAKKKKKKVSEDECIGKAVDNGAQELVKKKKKKKEASEGEGVGKEADNGAQELVRKQKKKKEVSEDDGIRKEANNGAQELVKKKKKKREENGNISQEGREPPTRSGPGSDQVLQPREAGKERQEDEKAFSKVTKKRLVSSRDEPSTNGELEMDKERQQPAKKQKMNAKAAKESPVAEEHVVVRVKKRKTKAEKSSAGLIEGAEAVSNGHKEQQEPGTKKKMKTVVAKTILKNRDPETDREAQTHEKTKKKVRFQVPEEMGDEEVLSADEMMGDSLTEMDAYNWKNDHLRPGVVYGSYSKEEDEVLKQAIFDYIREKGWDQEDGLNKVLNSWSHREARGCWSIIGKCLPNRTLRRLHSRAHRLLNPGTYLGKWTSEEVESLRELHAEHGNNWRKISNSLGRDPANCKEKWRALRGNKKGPWSQEELEKLCALIFKCLHLKRQMAESGTLEKNHKVLRDNINWEFVAEHMEGRTYLQCLSAWYNKMASSMVSSGDWSNIDDQLLLERMMENFAMSEEMVDWDSLLEHRSGEICRKRWEQMQRTLGEHRRSDFLDQLELLIKRYAPYLLDDEYDQQFAERMQVADAMQNELEEEN